MRAVFNSTTARVVFGLGLAAGLGGGVARADSGSDSTYNPNTIALGLYNVSFHTHADDITGGGDATPAGLNVRNPGINTLYAAYMRQLSAHFEAELTLGVPPLTKTTAKGPAEVGSVPYNGQTIATARWFAPSALIKYYLFTPDTMIRPYLGVGVNYTKFYSRQVTTSGEQISGGPTSLSLPSSVGPVGNVGVAFKPMNHLVLIASWSASWVNTRLTTDTAGLLRTSHVEFNPRAIVVAAGYQF